MDSLYSKTTKSDQKPITFPTLFHLQNRQVKLHGVTSPLPKEMCVCVHVRVSEEVSLSPSLQKHICRLQYIVNKPPFHRRFLNRLNSKKYTIRKH